MPGGNIFLNYRRADTAGHAGRLFDRLDRLFPVLVEGARMPSAEDLPADLKPLARRDALEITEPDFENDVARLVRTLAEALAEPPPGAEPHAPHAPHAAVPRRAGLHLGLVAAGLALLALVAVVAWLGLYASRDAGGPGGQALTSPPAPATRAADADSFDPVGVWEAIGIGTDLRRGRPTRVRGVPVWN